MYVITIDNKTYKTVSAWSEMKLKDAEAVFNIVMPEKLRDYYNLLLSNDDDKQKKLAELIFTKQELEKDFPLFYGQVICALSDVPDRKMQFVKRISREEIYRFKSGDGVSCMSVVMGVMKEPFDFKPKGLKSFEWQGETLLMPETRKILGIERPLANESAITFCESADLLINSEKVEQGKYKSMANIIAILCRPKDEQYDEAKSLKRADTMGELSMDIVWEIFFCLSSAYNMLGDTLLTYLRELESTKQKQPLIRELKNMAGMVIC